ncbi:MAG: hypothetical protein ABRQ26_11055 [Syntrophomonadaceae bacterium]
MWIKSPYRNDRNEWMLSLLFESEEGELVRLETAWGSLPWLRFGQGWQNGQPLETFKDGSISRFSFDFTSMSGEVFSAESHQQAYFKESWNIGKESVWLFEFKDKPVCIPCIEIIRCFFAPHTTLAMALLEPHGLEFLATIKSKFSNHLKIHIDNQIPSKVITESLVKHVGWLLTDKYAKQIWDSVVQSIFPRGYKELESHSLFSNESANSRSANTIKAVPPIQGPSQWEVRAIEGFDSYLVLEIVRVSGISSPYPNMTWTHNMVRKRRTRAGERDPFRSKRSNRPKRQKRDFLITDESPKGKSKTIAVDVSPTMLSFDQPIEVIKESIQLPVPIQKRKDGKIGKREQIEREMQFHQENKHRFKQERVPGNEYLFSNAEVDFSSNQGVSPIELIGAKVIETSNIDGLETFHKMISAIRAIQSTIEILDQRVMLIPSGKRFSFNENGTARKVALVSVKVKEKYGYIVEVERLSTIPLSTLLIWPRSGMAFNEVELSFLLNELLSGLISNNGHWGKTLLNNHPKAIFEKVKHLESWTVLDWADVLCERILFEEYLSNIND